MVRRSAQFRDIIIAAIPAGEERSFNDAGTIVACLAASAPLEMAFDDGNFFFVAPGLGYRPFDPSGQAIEFGSLIFRNPTGAPIDVHFQIGTGDIIDNRAVFGGTAIPVQPITFAVPQPVSQSGAWNVGLTGVYLPRAARPVAISNMGDLSCAASAVTLISAATAARSSYVLEHLGTETMYIKTPTTNNNNGIPIRPGERLEIETNGALNIRNPAAFAQTIRRAEITW
ncbi:MAG: hypothetical protein CVT72_03710 [Alphaproteobacteria bacterium HGW-Alphaproteobacteria-11]|nr:MAG: hypothetical protein CVT72_03710 [Alphaproteobacteria bacterium HGW-Alphaproteobacteria-11]